MHSNTNGRDSPRVGSPLRCQSLFEATASSTGPSACGCRVTLERTKGRSRACNFAVLDSLSSLLRQAADQGSATEFLKVAIAVVDWGGVRRNRARLDEVGGGCSRCGSRRRGSPQPGERGPQSAWRRSAILNWGASAKSTRSSTTNSPSTTAESPAPSRAWCDRYCEENCRDAGSAAACTSAFPRLGDGSQRNPSAGALHFPNTRWGDQYEGQPIAAWLLADLATAVRAIRHPALRSAPACPP